jgi:hypothetical protein
VHNQNLFENNKKTENNIKHTEKYTHQWQKLTALGQNTGWQIPFPVPP